MPRRRKSATSLPPSTGSEPPAAAAPTSTKRRRRSPRRRPGKTGAERTAGLLDAHRTAVDKTRAEAAANGTPNDWQVDTSWAAELDAPISVVSVGPPDPAKTDEILDAWAEFLVSVYLETKRNA
jgi:hypothetical protein